MIEKGLVCINIWNLIVEVSTPITAFATILLTYFIYRLRSKNSLKENYFRHMVELYYKIEDDSINMAIGNNKIDTLAGGYQVKQAERRIKVNSVIMIYYLLRIPCYYDERWEFFRIHYNTSCNPDNMDNYERIAEYFKKFCWNLRDKKKTDNSFSFDYDGSPIIK